MTDKNKDTTKRRKDGGPADRLDWLTCQLQFKLTISEVKTLILMVRDADETGEFWSSYPRLQRMAGLCRTAWFRARKGLIEKGIIRRIFDTDKKYLHQLTGADNGWEIDDTAWKRPKHRGAAESPSDRDAVVPVTGTPTVPATGTESVPMAGTSTPTGTQDEPSACASGAVALVQPREPNGENQPSESTDPPPPPPTANAGGGGSIRK